MRGAQHSALLEGLEEMKVLSLRGERWQRRASRRHGRGRRDTKWGSSQKAGLQGCEFCQKMDKSHCLPEGAGELRICLFTVAQDGKGHIHCWRDVAGRKRAAFTARTEDALWCQTAAGEETAQKQLAYSWMWIRLSRDETRGWNTDMDSKEKRLKSSVQSCRATDKCCWGLSYKMPRLRKLCYLSSLCKHITKSMHTATDWGQVSSGDLTVQPRGLFFLWQWIGKIFSRAWNSSGFWAELDSSVPADLPIPKKKCNICHQLKRSLSEADTNPSTALIQRGLLYFCQNKHPTGARIKAETGNRCISGFIQIFLSAYSELIKMTSFKALPQLV